MGNTDAINFVNFVDYPNYVHILSQNNILAQFCSLSSLTFIDYHILFYQNFLSYVSRLFSTIFLFSFPKVHYSRPSIDSTILFLQNKLSYYASRYSLTFRSHSFLTFQSLLSYFPIFSSLIFSPLLQSALLLSQSLLSYISIFSSHYSIIFAVSPLLLSLSLLSYFLSLYSLIFSTSPLLLSLSILPYFLSLSSLTFLGFLVSLLYFRSPFCLTSQSQLYQFRLLLEFPMICFHNILQH